MFKPSPSSNSKPPPPEYGWLDPQTDLEYASKAAFEQGCDPLPHWRNAEIKRIRRHTEAEGPRQARIQALFCYYARDGEPYEDRTDREPPPTYFAALFGAPFGTERAA